MQRTYIRVAALLCLGFPPVTSALDVWMVSPWTSQLILPNTDLGPPDDSPALLIVGTPGEFEAASMVIRSETQIESLSLKATPLGKTDATLPIANIDIKYVKAWYQGETAWQGPRIGRADTKKLVPELLLNNSGLVRVDRQAKKNFLLVQVGKDFRYEDISALPAFAAKHMALDHFVVRDSEELLPMTLNAHENQQLLVTIHIPETTLAGEYSGHILIGENGTTVGAIPITVHVLPFTLPAAPLLYGVYYRGQLLPRNKTISSEFKNEAQLRAELHNILAHGVQHPTVFQGNQNPSSESMLEELRSPRLLADYLAMRADVGLPKDKLFYVGRGTGNASTSAGLFQLRRFVRSIILSARSLGYGDVYFYGLDEASGEELLTQGASWAAVHKEGGKVFAASNRHDIIRMGNLVDLAIMARDVPVDIITALKARGILTLNYNNPQSAVEDPHAFRHNYGFALWARGYDGAMIYAYQHGFGSIWNDLDHERFRDHCLTYPTTDGVIDTLAWEGLREGIDDVRYLARLLDDLAQVEMDNGPGIVALKDEAKNLLELIRENSSWTPDAVRKEIIRLVLSLNALRVPARSPQPPKHLRVSDP